MRSDLNAPDKGDQALYALIIAVLLHKLSCLTLHFNSNKEYAYAVEEWQ